MHRKRKRKLCLIMFTVLLGISGCSDKKKETSQEVKLVQEESGPDGKQTEEEAKKNTKEPVQPGDGESKQTIVIYVCGQVNRPGIVKLPEGSRMYEAIEMAGGLTEKAAVSCLNQAEILSDGTKIYVPDQEEAVSREELSVGNTGGNPGGQFRTEKININQASKEELMTLPGIGESKADHILAYRQEHGRFGSIDELMNISGIKEGVFEKIKDKITV